MSNKMKVVGVRKDPKTGIEITSIAPIDEKRPCKECKKNPRVLHSSRCKNCNANRVTRKLNDEKLQKKIEEEELQK